MANKLNIAIGAYIDKSLAKSFKKTESAASRLGKAYRETNKKLAAVRQVDQYRQRLARLRQQQQQAGGSNQQLANAIRRTEQSLSRASRSAQRYGVNLNNLARTQRQLQRTARFQGLQQSGMQRLGQLKTAGKWAAGGLAGAAGGLLAMVKSTADRGDPIAKHAAKLGFSVEGLQEYQYAAERSGVSTAQFNTASQRMVRRVSEAAAGIGKTGKALKELGLDAKWLNSLKPEEQFEHISEAMKHIPNKADRVRLAMKLFDTEGVGLVNMLKDGKKGLDALRKDARATGNIISKEDAKNAEDFQDAFLDFKLTIGSVSKSVGAKFMPLVTRMMIKFKTFHEKYGARFNQVLIQVADSLVSVGRFMWNLGKTVVTVASKVSHFIEETVGWKNIAAVVAALIGVKLVGAVLAAGSALIAFIPAIKAVGLAMMANPVGLIIKAIAIGATLIITHWSTVSTFLGDTFDTVANACSSAFETIKHYFFNFTPLGLLISNWEPITDYFGNLWERVKAIFGVAWEAIKNYFFTSTPLGLLIANWDQIKDYFRNLWDSVLNAFSSGVNNIKNRLSSFSAKKLFMKVWQPAIDWLRSKFQWINKAIEKLKGIKRWFTGDDEEEKKTVAGKINQRTQQRRAQIQETQGVNAKQIEKRLQQINQQKNMNVTTHLNAPITINAAPGMSAEEVTQQVKDALEEREQEAEARQRSVLYDTDMATL
ncbi:hypothetical protein [Spartinivicinus marinus]|uniref:hypothetical protein n=1 Tax=Spartinivicinus marinus TaxID=2994442 RepID=UPI002253C08F|nr:hypothetical protein [Spartinivicinus marinus]MCX4025099.1 hypothetical protein [Spartinivicinus marinus]